MKHLVAIVGMPGAGKSEAGAFFRKKNMPVLRFGDVTDDGLREQGLSLTQENEKPFRENLRAELGMGAYAIKMEPRIQKALEESEIAFLDGLRSWEEYVYLKEKFPQLQLLCIIAPSQVRYDRLTGRLERRLTAEEARSRDISELTALHMGPPIAIADWYILNNGTQEELSEKLETFWRTLE